MSNVPTLEAASLLQVPLLLLGVLVLLIVLLLHSERKQTVYSVQVSTLTWGS